MDLTNSSFPDEITRSVTFRLGLSCLPLSHKLIAVVEGINLCLVNQGSQVRFPASP